MHYLLGFVAGIATIAFLPYLPPPLTPWFVLIVALVLVGYQVKKKLEGISCLVLGLIVGCLLGSAWGLFQAQNFLKAQLPDVYHQQEFALRGWITGLPQHRGHYWRFIVQVEDMALLDQPSTQTLPPIKKILLLWYGETPELHPGDFWQLKVKLKSIRGMVNPGVTDSQGRMLQQGIGARGIVVSHLANRPVPAPEDAISLLKLRLQVDAWRYRLRQQLLALPLLRPDLVLGLSIGDRSTMAPQSWQLLQQTGTSHLMAISGLHIGIVGGLGFLLFAWVLRWTVLLAPGHVVTRYGALLGSIGLAGMYAALAGFTLPTQRALIMLLGVQVALVVGSVKLGWRLLVIAAAVVMIIDPLAVHNKGFWLSFGAVSWLMFTSGGRLADRAISASGTGRLVWIVRRAVTAQCSVALGLSTVLLALNLPTSPLGVVANLVAIPLMSLWILPWTLAGLLCLNWPSVSQFLLSLADFGLDILWAYLQWLTELPAEGLSFGGSLGINKSFGTLAVACFGVLWLLMPKGWPSPWLGLCFFLPLLSPKGDEGTELGISILDVGQGLAVVVNNGQRTLVYDTGPAFGPGFDAGRAVVAPFVRWGGSQSIDTLVISHGDLDHAGGAESLNREVPIHRVLASSPPAWAGAKASKCDSRLSWRWHSMEFRILWPLAGHALPERSNNRSCVLLIRVGSVQVLLPGDIEAEVEKQLLRENRLPQNIDILVAPHHGSQTSSTVEFIDKLKPKVVVFSAGYRNRYGHPNSEVVTRYRRRGALVLNTAQSGAITFVWGRTVGLDYSNIGNLTQPREGRESAGEMELLRIEEARKTRRRYWFTDE